MTIDGDSNLKDKALKSLKAVACRSEVLREQWQHSGWGGRHVKTHAVALGRARNGTPAEGENNENPLLQENSKPPANCFCITKRETRAHSGARGRALDRYGVLRGNRCAYDWRLPYSFGGDLPESGIFAKCIIPPQHVFSHAAAENTKAPCETNWSIYRDAMPRRATRFRSITTLSSTSTSNSAMLFPSSSVTMPNCPPLLTNCWS